MTTTRVLILDIAPGVGGGERATLSAASRFHEIDPVVAASPPIAKYATELDLEAIEFELPKLSDVRAIWRIALGAVAVKRLATKSGVRIILANTRRSITYSLAARILGGPLVIVHNHELLPPGLVTFAAQRLSAAIVVPSEAAGRPFGGEKLKVIANGIDLERFSPGDPRSSRINLGLPPDALIVGTLTRPDPAKGMAPFVRVAALLAQEVPEAFFLLAGGPVFPHEERHYREIGALAAELLNGRVLLIGDIHDPVAAYRSMDLMVHLGKPESFGMAVVEAMACGVPVVAYNWGGVSEVVVDQVSGLLVRPGDEEAAFKALYELTKDSDRRVRMGRDARSQCERRFSFDAFAAALEDCIRNVVARQK